MRNILFIFIIPLLFTACNKNHVTEQKKISDVRITDANEVYLRWTGSNPPADVHVEKGQYWQSGHFTNEYIMYLKLKPTAEWWKLYIEQNKLEVKTDSWYQQQDTPAWFKPSNHSSQHGPSDFDQGSRYFRDSLTGECYIYEIQL